MIEAPKVILTLPTGEVRKYSLQMDSVRLGRAADNTVVLEDPSLSSHHAALHRRDEGFEIIDLGSTNGIEYQGQRVMNHLLRHGDEVKIGEVTMVYHDPGREGGEKATSTGEGDGEEDDTGEGAPDPDAMAKGAKKMATPAAGQAATAPARASAPSQDGCLAPAILFAFTLLAPVVGLHIRHFSETKGRILAVDVLNHWQAGDEEPAESATPAEPVAQ